MQVTFYPDYEYVEKCQDLLVVIEAEKYSDYENAGKNDHGHQLKSRY